MTVIEVDTLRQPLNVADGHVFRGWLPDEQAVIDATPALFAKLNRRDQARIEQDYVHDFMKLARQSYCESKVGALMVFTASMAFEILANWLRRNQKSVALIEPTFDNLPDIFRRHDLPLTALPDSWMEAPAQAFEEKLQQITEDCICVVTPNNPTGAVLVEPNLVRLAHFCAERGKLLILDTCFRAYLPREKVHDQYALLYESGADFIVIEDTGKTWPTVEIKAPFFCVSRANGLFDQVYEIYTDFLLHVSPVGIGLVHEFIKLSLRDDLSSVHNVVATNRRMLYDALRGGFLRPCEKPFASVAWLAIDAPITGTELKSRLDRLGVAVLAGDYFFWSDHAKGEQFLRVALTRDADSFAESARVIGALAKGPLALTDVEGAIRREGFAAIPAAAWLMDRDLAVAFEAMRNDWELLEADNYLKAGATFRRRRYGRFYWSPLRDLLISLAHAPYFQPESENGYAGGIQRNWAPLAPETACNPFLTQLIRRTFAELPLSSERRAGTWEVRVHQIRIIGNPRELGEPAPEGIHQDGTDFLTLHLIHRDNVKGAESTIYDLGKTPLFKWTMREPMDSFIIEDPRIFHGVTPFGPANEEGLAIRDLLGIDFIYSPTLERPTE